MTPPALPPHSAGPGRWGQVSVVMGQRDASLGWGKLGGGTGWRVHGGAWTTPHQEFAGVSAGLKSRGKSIDVHSASGQKNQRAVVPGEKDAESLLRCGSHSQGDGRVCLGAASMSKLPPGLST